MIGRGHDYVERTSSAGDMIASEPGFHNKGSELIQDIPVDENDAQAVKQVFAVHQRHVLT